MDSKADDDEEVPGSDADDGFEEDMEALRRACILTGTDPNSLQPSSAAVADDTDAGTALPFGGTASDSEEDDLELVRRIQQRFSACTDAEAPLFLKPLSTLPPVLSDDEDDFETLRAIQRRFAGYDKDSKENSGVNSMDKLERVHATNTAVEEKTCNNLVADRTNVSEGFPDSLDGYNTSQKSETNNDNDPVVSPSGLIEWHEPDAHNLAIIAPSGSGFPKSAQMFVDAIKKNRACQKFLRSKLIQIEARIEENKKLKQRVKTLKDFQVSCKKRTGRALSQKKDARVQLIAAVKPKVNLKANGKKATPLKYGPNENSHVPIYRAVLKKYPISLNREKWSDDERQNLAKGIKQQFQELLLQKSVDLISDVDGSPGGSNGVDSIITSIRDLDITPEIIRSFLPKVNWERLASMYVKGRSGAECEARWLNCEDPLINHHQWTKQEETSLLNIIQRRGIGDWISISVLLGTNRTPFQCLARYQRSLNASIMKREWTEDEDDKLRAAVEAFGESNWQFVASSLEGRTGTQCSNRWMKSLHPARQRVGRWSSDEDKRLKIAVMLFGPNNWRKIAQFVPGRTHVQCRERWCNSLNPCLIMGQWTEEEDSRLNAAVVVHNYCWSTVAECLPPRTDNQCRRQWMKLNPDKVSLLQASKQIMRKALMSNFVDRESERPALEPSDFIPLALTNAVSESENLNPSRKQKRKSRTKRPTKEAQICPGEVPLLINGNEVENHGGDDSILQKRAMKIRAKKKSSFEPTQYVKRNGPVRLSGGWPKKKKSCGRQKRQFRGRPEAASGGDAIPKKERTMKRYLKKNRRKDPTEVHLSASTDSELLIMPNRAEEVRELDGDRAGKRKASNSGQRNRVCVKLIDEVSGLKSDEVVSSGGTEASSEKKKTLSLLHLEQDICIDSTQVDSSCPVPSSPKITNVNEVEAFFDDGARKNNAWKVFAKRSKYNRLMEELLEMSDSSEVETLGGNDNSLKKKRVTKHSLEKCTLSSKSFTSENKVEAFSGNNASKKSKARKLCSGSKHTDLPQEADDENIITLHREKRAPRRKCFIQLGNHGDCTSSFLKVTESQSKQNEPTKLVNGFHSDNGNSSASGVFPEKSLKRLRTREKSCSNERSEAEEEDDMTLALFIKNKRKKRRHKLAEMGKDASSVSHELFKEPLSIDVDGVYEDSDDPSDTFFPPPGFESRIYRRVPS